MKKYSITVLLMLISSTIFANDIGVRFGSFIPDYSDDSEFIFVRKMTRVPLVTQFEGGLYGVEFSASDNQEYTVQVIATVRCERWKP
jgi:hypothetical protein